MERAAKRAFKDRLYEQFARLGKALSSPHRLELLDLLAQGERTVEKLAVETGMSIANTSQHLQALRAAQLLEVRRHGTFASYRLADEGVLRFWLALRGLAEARLAEIDRLVDTYLHDRGSLVAVTAGQLLDRMKAGGVVLLDVRPPEEYAAGHIAGARSMPIAELERRLQEIPKRREVVAYCRGPYCVYADEAVALLREHGYRAQRLDVGLPEWKAMSLPVAAGA
jgi:rhodanese-related sulfurtransferase/DNA-binding transcriptional ArsR family regulator